MSKSTKSTKPNAPPTASASNQVLSEQSETIGGVEPVEGEPFRFRVKSDTTDEMYLIDIQDCGFTGACNCMHWLARIAPKVALGLRGPKARCKHIVRAREYFLEHVLPKLAFAMGMDEPDLLEGPKPTTEYMRKRNAFLSKYRKCAVYPMLDASEPHHSRGRLGPLLLDERYWIPVSRIGHCRIDAEREWARTQIWNGVPLLCARGDWNRA